jgi:hypothetical protein
VGVFHILLAEDHPVFRYSDLMKDGRSVERPLTDGKRWRSASS